MVSSSTETTLHDFSLSHEVVPQEDDFEEKYGTTRPFLERFYTEDEHILVEKLTIPAVLWQYNLPYHVVSQYVENYVAYFDLEFGTGDVPVEYRITSCREVVETSKILEPGEEQTILYYALANEFDYILTEYGTEDDSEPGTFAFRNGMYLYMNTSSDCTYENMPRMSEDECTLLLENEVCKGPILIAQYPQIGNSEGTLMNGNLYTGDCYARTVLDGHVFKKNDRIVQFDHRTDTIGDLKLEDDNVISSSAGISKFLSCGTVRFCGNYIVLTTLGTVSIYAPQDIKRETCIISEGVRYPIDITGDGVFQHVDFHGDHYSVCRGGCYTTNVLLVDGEQYNMDRI
jgi:hypothetical protein